MFSSGICGRPTALLSTICIAISFLFCAAQFATQLAAQDDTDPLPAVERVTEPIEEQITREIVEEELSRVSETADLDETTRSSLQKLYQETLQTIGERESFRKRIAQFESMIANVSEQTAEHKKAIAAPKDEPTPIDDSVSLEDLQQRLATKQSEAEKARDEADRLAAETTRRQLRLTQIPELRDKIKQDLNALSKQLDAEAPDGELPLLTRARRVNLLVKKQRLEAQLEEFAKEQAAYTATANLLPLQRDLSRQKSDFLQAELLEINNAIATTRGSVARQLVAEANDLIGRLPEDVKSIAQCNLDLAIELQKVNKENSHTIEQLRIMQSRIELLDADLKSDESRVETVGLTESLGIMLRERRSKLVKQRALHRPTGNAGDRVREMQVQTFAYEDRLAAIRNTDTTDSKKLMACLSSKQSLPGISRGEMEEVLEQRIVLLEKLIESQQLLIRSQVAYDTAQHRFVRDVGEFVTYIDKHILWIRSSPPWSQDIQNGFSAAIGWFVDPQNWRKLLTDFNRSLRLGAPKYFLLFLGVVLLFGFHKRFRRIVKETGDDARDRRRISFLPTVISLLATIFLSATWIAPVLLLGWILIGRANNSEFTIATGHALIGAAFFVAPWEFLRNVWRDDGLAEDHFGWGQDLTRFFHKHLRWFFPIATPMLFIMVMLNFQSHESFRNSLGRLVAIVLFVCMAVFLHVVFHPRRVFFQRLKATYDQSRLYQLRNVIYPIVLAIPIVLALLTIVGYYYTAYELGKCFQQTAAAFIVLLVTIGVVMRWLFVRRRKLIRAEATSRLLAMKLDANTSDASAVIAESAGIDVQDDNETRISSLSDQARRIVLFVYVGLAITACLLIWRDVLPAVGILDGVEVWTVTIAERVEKVTLADLVYALIAGLVTVVAVRNLPGLIELTVLRHSMLDSGARYAVTTIFRYFLIVVGLMTALSFLSIPWSQYGWLVAAVTVGLGFGLQEIVANFVSGLILLLERPVRVGDVVTIDGTSGVVSRIQMRATTITNWDRQELIVPNKDLITGKLLNWSLSNVINRLVVKIGVAYGSDVDEVTSIIEKVVSSHELVLDDPGPLINFEQMDDSALLFVARCYLSGLDHRITVTHELNRALINALTDAGISIPFPQRDLHINPVPQELIDRLASEKTVSSQNSSDRKK